MLTPTRLASLVVAGGLWLAAVTPDASTQPISHGHPAVRFLPTPQNVVEAMLDFAQVTASDVVYDLGSGDGRIPITAAARYGARGVGIEIDPALVRQSEEAAHKAGVSGLVTFVTGDLFQADVSQATVVALFLLPGMNIDLIPKFRSQLRPGARIVSHHFAMADRWLPDDMRDVNGLEIFLWRLR
jgi:cyclopropane fatty-acyl-phospholipid synthase-like methyltransferase